MLDPFPIWDDIRTFDATEWRGKVDVITAGFPCQPFSVAGQRARENDERNMWPDTLRCIRELGPRYCLLENVPGLVRCDYFGQILGDLADAGYDAEWDIVSAADVGAPHRRRRLWIVANPRAFNGSGEDVADAKGGILPRFDRGEGAAFRSEGCGEDVADTEGNRIQESGHVDSQAGKGNGPRAFNGSSEDVADSGCERLQASKLSGVDESKTGKRQKSTPGPVAQRNHNGDGGWETTYSKCVPWQDLWETGRVGREGQPDQRNRGGPWPVEPDVGRVANGVPARVDRLKAIGNAQVPAVVRVAWHILT
jgi:DNA (cytosine-5)-methyltransferase 1